ncbi:DNA helicase, UvrD/REP type [gut metagenome]|uniref:DNA helicase, UvrD/REP type n=1 Tax=gut metagenome TaxID=749906 RepID=J9FJ24_9ZZZZ
MIVAIKIVSQCFSRSRKTAVLVERLCRFVIEDHIPIQSILAMTFTEDAAREMKVTFKTTSFRDGSRSLD